MYGRRYSARSTLYPSSIARLIYVAACEERLRPYVCMLDGEHWRYFYFLFPDVRPCLGVSPSGVLSFSQKPTADTHARQNYHHHDHNRRRRCVNTTKKHVKYARARACLVSPCHSPKGAGGRDAGGQTGDRGSEPRRRGAVKRGLRGGMGAEGALAFIRICILRAFTFTSESSEYLKVNGMSEMHMHKRPKCIVSNGGLSYMRVDLDTFLTSQQGRVFA